MKYKTRMIIGFDGVCPYNCKHCYAKGCDRHNDNRSINELINSIENREFDIIYLSQKYENFYNEQAGFELCKGLFLKYKKDIYIITRSELSEETIEDLSNLNSLMDANGCRLIIGTSLCAYESYLKTESILCPKPDQRINCLKKLHDKGLLTVLLLRPVFPNHFIPVNELQTVIYRAADYCDCIISSGLIVSQEIISKLGMDLESVKYMAYGDSSYLDDMDKASFAFLDVEEELKILEKTAIQVGKPFFRHSMPALNSLVKK